MTSFPFHIFRKYDIRGRFERDLSRQVTAGIGVVELFSKPDGTFPNHHPDPTIPEALQELIDEEAVPFYTNFWT